ncbi:uncharacterized protein CBL_12201 [Carabus blaptoides fortunei]
MLNHNFVQLRYLPVLCFVWLVSTFIVSYAVATSLDHVYPVWPYISDTGTLPPESCIFGLMLNVGSLLMGLVLFVRYKQIKMIMQSHDRHNRILNLMNMFCFLTGMIAAIGACIVANFQETSEITTHLFGAMLCFGVGSAYFIVHTIICFFISRHTFSLNLLRVVLCVIYVISFAFTMIFARMAFAEYKVSFKGAMQWNPDNPGYDLRLTSTFSEWVLATCQGLYILSMTYDFRTISYKLTFALTEEHSGDGNRQKNSP